MGQQKMESAVVVCEWVEPGPEDMDVTRMESLLCTDGALVLLKCGTEEGYRDVPPEKLTAEQVHSWILRRFGGSGGV